MPAVTPRFKPVAKAHQSPRALLLAVLFPLAAACSSSAEPNGADADVADVVDSDAGDVVNGDEGDALGDTTPDTPELDEASLQLLQQVCMAQAQWRCEVASLCTCPDAAVASDCIPAAESECMARVAAQVERASEAIAVDGAGAARCIEAWSTAVVDCGPMQFARFDAACGAVLVSEVAIGAPCDDEQLPCAAGAGLCVDGVCTALLALGDQCDAGDAAESACAVGLLCVAGECRGAPLAVGDLCDSSEQCEAGARCVGELCVETATIGQPCSDSTPCRGALLCEEGVCVAGNSDECVAPGPSSSCGEEALCGAARSAVCEAPGSAGTPCSDSAQCDADTFCNSTTQECEPRPGDEAPCGDGIWCADGLACAMETTTCAPIPQRDEPCALGLFGPFTCAEGLACVDRTCGEIPTEGQRCGGGAVCAEGLGCAFEETESVCRALRGAGGVCDNDTICEAGTHCDFGALQCRANFEAGETCSQGNECGSDGSCMPDAEGSFACAPVPAAGEPCFLDCAEGLTCVTRLDSYACYPSICALNW